MYQSIEDIKRAYHQGEKLDFVFFWGHHPSKLNQVTKNCLSQWWFSEFEVEGITYQCAEQFMMAEKARLFGDDAIKKLILKESNPKEIKALGRRISHFNEDIWKKNCREIVRKGNLAKFSQNPSLRTFLLSTKDLILVEASPYDTIWGIGMSESDKNILNPDKWRGTNYLGLALMWVREQLKVV